MELFIEVHDNAGVVHKYFQPDIHKSDTLARLKEKIFIKWFIHEKYHRLFTENGEELVGPDETSLQSLGLEDGSKVILKHSELQVWEEYKKCVDLVVVKQENQTENARKAVKLCETWGIGSLFDLYNSFDKFRWENNDEIIYWADEGIQMIQKATKDHFRNLHDQKRSSEESEFICYFKGNGYASTHAFVQIHGEDSVTEYNVKYIAIQRNDNFEELETDGDENNLCADVIVQLAMLEVLLHVYIERYEKGGKWKGTQNAALVYFIPDADDEPPIHSDIKQEMLEQIRNWSGYKEEHDDRYWLNLVKVYLDRWDLPSKIELAWEELDPTGVLLKNFQGLSYELNEYIEILNKNLESLQTALNSIVQ